MIADAQSRERTAFRLPPRGGSWGAIATFVLVVVALGAARFAIGRGLHGALELTITAIATLAPLIAAIALTASNTGRDGLRDLRRRVSHWRIHPRWYVLGVAVPVLVYWAVLGAYATLGGARPVFEASLLLVVAEVLIVGPLFYLVEETGWRGWLQRAVQGRTSALIAALVVAVVWVAWHVPLLYIPGTPQSEIHLAAFAALAIPAAVVFAWVYNATAGSVPAVVIAHLGFNMGVGLSVTALPADVTTYVALCAVPTALLALLVVFATGGRLALPEVRPETARTTST